MSEVIGLAPMSACRDCLRRSWLLSDLSPLLDYHRGRRERLLELLDLPDEQLIDALAGRRRAQLKMRHEAFDPEELPVVPGVQAICRHDARYPGALKGSSSHPALYLRGEACELTRALQTPAVAILGSRRPSDYGCQIAAELARGLVASGITVLLRQQPGIAAAAHAGAAQLGGNTLAVASDGIGPANGAPRPTRHREQPRADLALSELPCGTNARGWGPIASERVLLGLASLVLLVEDQKTATDIAAAREAKDRGKPLGAVPGQVTSSLAAGPHTLLLDGAHLIRGTQDVLEVLCSDAAGDHAAPAPPPPGSGLPPRLREVYELVLSGRDTPDRLAGSTQGSEIFLALSELEIAGLLRRGPRGRYAVVR